MIRELRELEIINKFGGLNILVIGDLMLDRYLMGSVDRISPEAPVPIVLLNNEKCVPGGAANVAANIRALGGSPVVLGIVGDDSSGKKLVNELSTRGIDVSGIIISPTRKTTVKTRVLSNGHQMLRLDEEETTTFAGSIPELHLINTIESMAKNADAIVISDYAKGVITFAVCEAARRTGKKIIVDPKPNHKAFYKGVYLITPNKKEAEGLSGMQITDDEAAYSAAKKISQDIDCNVMMKRGEQGITLFQKDKLDVDHILAIPREVYDVSGAGDTAISTAALCVAAGASLTDACELANIAAGLTVEKIGTSTISAEELISEIARLNNND